MAELMYDAPDDYKEVPEEIQKKIITFIDEDLFPAILGYIAPNYPKLRYITVEDFLSYQNLLEGAFSKEQWNDLSKLEHITFMPGTVYRKIYGRDLVGALIRISKAIGKEEFKAKLQNIVLGCFIPNEHPDPTDPFKTSLAL
jgi:hypothetical protein